MPHQEMNHAQKVKKGRSAKQDVRDMRASVRLAKEMGQGLGRGALLFGPMPRRAQRSGLAAFAIDGRWRAGAGREGAREIARR